MTDTFTLTIQLGNAAMVSNADIADALDRLSEKFRQWELEALAVDDGPIIDANGNTVGRWRIG